MHLYKKVLFLSLGLLVAGCEKNYPQEEMVIYTKDMQYACKGPSYRIFHTADILNVEQEISQDEILEIYQNADVFESNENPDKNSIIARDIKPVFLNSRYEHNFYVNESTFRSCYIIKFKGKFKSNNLFNVDFYEYIPDKKCIQENIVSTIEYYIEQALEFLDDETQDLNKIDFMFMKQGLSQINGLVYARFVKEYRLENEEQKMYLEFIRDYQNPRWKTSVLKLPNSFQNVLLSDLFLERTNLEYIGFEEIKISDTKKVYKHKYKYKYKYKFTLDDKHFFIEVALNELEHQKILNHESKYPKIGDGIEIYINR